MREAGARYHFVGRAQVAHRRIIGEQWLAAGGERHGCPSAYRSHDVGLRLIGEIQHSKRPQARAALHGSPPTPAIRRLVGFLLRRDKIVNIVRGRGNV
jgi:hypothetical protein